jgi:hypothetical protein
MHYTVLEKKWFHVMVNWKEMIMAYFYNNLFLIWEELGKTTRNPTR